MKKIYAVEMVDQDGKVVFRTPFDVFTTDLNITSIEELEEQFSLQDSITSECCKTRYWFLTFRFPNHTKRLAVMDWKWDEEFYKNMGDCHGKGPDSADEAMFKY